MAWIIKLPLMGLTAFVAVWVAMWVARSGFQWLAARVAK